MAACAEAQKAAVAEGFPDNVATYALVSSIWTSTFALGAFLGPTTAGGLYNLVGFRWSTLFLVAWNVVVATGAVLLLLARALGFGCLELCLYGIRIGGIHAGKGSIYSL